MRPFKKYPSAALFHKMKDFNTKKSMEAKPARWSQSFNKFRLMKNLRSCPDFPISSWTGPSPAVFGVWEPSIQIILSSLTLQRRKWGSPTGVSCAPTRRWWDQSMPSPPQSTPPPAICPASPLYCLLAGPRSSRFSRVHPWCGPLAQTLIPSCRSIPIKATVKVLLCTRSV